MARSKSSQRWLKAHFADPFVKQAQQEGYRSRAAFKLVELQERDKLVKPGMTVIELGAAPGGWSQLLARWVDTRGRVIAMDILPMASMAGVEFIQGDFHDAQILNKLLASLGEHKADIIFSDMAPNASGMVAIDQPRAMALAESALAFVHQALAPDGAFVIKLFQGAGFEDYVRQLRQHFAKVLIRKPEASRAASRENYLVAKSYRGNNR